MFMLTRLLPLLGLFERGFAGMGFGEIAIMVVGIAAIVALVYVALVYFEVQIPPIVVKVFWICCVAFLIIMAIRLVMGM